MAESKEELQSLLIKVKEENEKASLKLNIEKTKMASGLVTAWKIDGSKSKWKQWQILFYWVPKSLQMVTTATKFKACCSLGEKYDKPRQGIKKQRHHFADKGSYSQSCGFSSSYIWMQELYRKKV